MPMPKAFYDKLNTALKDIVYDDKPAIDIVKANYDNAEKFEKDNKDIIEGRDKLKTKYNALKEESEANSAKITEFQTTIEELKKDVKSDDDKNILDKGMSKEAEAKFNTLTQALEDLKAEQLKDREDKLKAIESAAKTSLKAEKLNVYGEIRKQLANVGIKDTNNQDIAIAVMQQQGMVDVKPKENNEGYDHSYYYNKDGKTLSFDGVTELANHMKDTYKNLVDSSGNVGSGNDHNDKGGNATKKEYASVTEATSAAKDMMFKPKEN